MRRQGSVGRDGVRGAWVALHAWALVVLALALAPPRAVPEVRPHRDHVDTGGEPSWLRVAVAPPPPPTQWLVELDGRPPRQAVSAQELRVGVPPLEPGLRILHLGRRHRGAPAESVHVPVVTGPFLPLDRWEGEALALRLPPGAALAGAAAARRALPPEVVLPGGARVALRVVRVTPPPDAVLWLDARVAGAAAADWGRVTDPGADSARPPAGPPGTLTVSPRLVAAAWAASWTREALEEALRAGLREDALAVFGVRVAGATLRARPALVLDEAGHRVMLPVVALEAPGAPGLELTLSGAVRLRSAGPPGDVLVPELTLEHVAHRCRRPGRAPAFAPCLESLALAPATARAALAPAFGHLPPLDLGPLRRALAAAAPGAAPRWAGDAPAPP